MKRKHNTMRLLVSKGVVRMGHVHTDESLADPLTKGIAKEEVHNTSRRWD
jgi:hypothetical protein